MDIEQQHLDRAAEWLGEWEPELEGEAYEKRLNEVACELAELDLATQMEPIWESEREATRPSLEDMQDDSVMGFQEMDDLGDY